MSNTEFVDKQTKIPDSSDLLARKKRNVHIQVHNSKIGTDYDKRNRYDQGSSRISLMNAQRGLDQYNSRGKINVSVVSGTYIFEGTYDPATLDLEALKQVFAKLWNVPVSDISLTVRPGSIIMDFTITNVTVSNGFGGINLPVVTQKITPAIQLTTINGLYFLSQGPPTFVSNTVTYAPYFQVKTALGSGRQNQTNTINPSYLMDLVAPSGICTDNDDNIYFSENNAALVKIDTLGNYSNILTTASGIDITQQRLTCVESDGTSLYYVDTYMSSVVRRILLSNPSYNSPWPDVNSEFDQRGGLAFSSTTTILYGAATNSHSIVANYPNQTRNSVILFAGSRQAGYRDGPITQALFNQPSGLAIDNVNNILYVGDKGNHCIRAINLVTNIVSTVAGKPGTKGWGDGDGIVATFNEPSCLAFNLNNSNWLFVGDSKNYCIRQIYLPTRSVQTIAGSGVSGYKDGPGAHTAKFGRICDMTLTNSGILYVTDPDNFTIRKINITYKSTSTAVTTLLKGIETPLAIAINETTSTLAVTTGIKPFSTAETNLSNIQFYSIDLDGKATFKKAVGGTERTFTGYQTDQTGRAFISNVSPLGSAVRGIAYANSKLLVTVSDYLIYRKFTVPMYIFVPMSDSELYKKASIILEIYDDETTINNLLVPTKDTVLSCNCASTGISNPPCMSMNFPTGICYEPINNNVYYIEPTCNLIRKFNKTTYATGFLGSNVNGINFTTLRAICTDNMGNLYIADGNMIRKIDTINNDYISTIAGSTNSGSTDGTSALFSMPSGLCWFKNVLYVCDYGTSIVRKIELSSTPTVTTIAGKTGVPGSTDGSFTEALLYYPISCCAATNLSGIDHLYVLCSDGTIRDILI